MTSQEFVTWLKGFTEGVHEYNITPKQWDLLKERLAEVEDNNDKFERALIDPYQGYGTPNHDLVQRYSPGIYGTVTSGYLSASALTGLTTSTATNLPSGSNITYTTNGAPTWYSINKIENDSREK